MKKIELLTLKRGLESAVFVAYLHDGSKLRLVLDSLFTRRHAGQQ